MWASARNYQTSRLHLKSHLKHHIRRKDIFHVLDGGPSLGVLVVGELGGLSGSRLHHHVEALLDQSLDAGGRERHATFVLEDLLGHADGELFVWDTCGRGGESGER